MEPENTLSRLEHRLGYRFRDQLLLKQAVTHRSYPPEAREDVKDNERLEFLGDAVLELVISDLLYNRFAHRFREGDLTKMRAYLVSEARLVDRAKALGLGAVIFMGRGEEKCGGRSRASILANAFEAITGAIYLDGGFRAAYTFLERQFGHLIDLASEQGLRHDYKSRLQEIIQKYFHSIPEYRLIDMSGPDHDRVFEIGLYFNNEEISRGIGRSKKEAEQHAARAAIDNLRRITSEHGIRQRSK